MSVIFPIGEYEWRRQLEAMIRQHHVDIQRLWKRTTEVPQPGGGDCCGLVGLPGGNEGIGSEPDGSFPGSFEGSHLSQGSGVSGGSGNSTGTGNNTVGSAGGSLHTYGTSNTPGTYGTTNTNLTKGTPQSGTGWQTYGSPGTTRTRGTSNTNLTQGTQTGGTPPPIWAIQCDGTNDYIAASDTGLPSGVGQALSICLWLKTTFFHASKYGPILKFGTEGTPYGRAAILFQYPNSNKISFDTYGGGVISAADINTGSWVHVVAVKPSGTDPLLTVYINGSASGNAKNANIAAGNGGTDYGLVLGGDLHMGKWLGTADFWPGVYDDVRIYDIALSGTDITNIYNGGAGTNTDPVSGAHLKRWYKMAEGTGTTTADSGSNGTSATLTSGPTWVTGKID